MIDDKEICLNRTVELAKMNIIVGRYLEGKSSLCIYFSSSLFVLKSRISKNVKIRGFEDFDNLFRFDVNFVAKSII